MQKHEATMLGGEPGEILWRGHRVAFTRHGQGSPVLLVHGMHAGASSFEWRHADEHLDPHQLVRRNAVFKAKFLEYLSLVGHLPFHC